MLIPVGITLVLFSLSLYLVLSGGSPYKNYELVMIVSTYLGFFSNIGFIFLFIGIVFGCRDRFNALNRRILLRLQPTSFEVRHCVELYQDLVKIIQKINRELAHPLILIFTSILITLTFNTFTSIKLYNKNLSGNRALIIINIFWTLKNSYMMIIVIQSSEGARNEAQKFLEHGRKILWEKKISDNQLSEDFKFFILSMNRENLQLKTIFFNIDWTLLLNVNFLLLIF